MHSALNAGYFPDHIFLRVQPLTSAWSQDLAKSFHGIVPVCFCYGFDHGACTEHAISPGNKDSGVQKIDYCNNICMFFQLSDYIIHRYHDLCKAMTQLFLLIS